MTIPIVRTTCSSMTGSSRPSPLAIPPVSARRHPLSLQKPFTDFLTGTTPLINRAYKPLPEDVAFAKNSTADANSLFTKHVNNGNAWKNIASRLEVEGMFNVNSTSVTAWRALLGHARNHKVPYTNGSGGGLARRRRGLCHQPLHHRRRYQGRLSGQLRKFLRCHGMRGIPRTRLRTARCLCPKNRRSDPQTRPFPLPLGVRQPSALKRRPRFGRHHPSRTERNGRKLLHQFLLRIDRGDRRPPAKKYASAGTLPQAAAAEYKFPEAATGICVYGIPGWTRQADVLRPLAPILSARDDTFVIRAYGDSRDASDKIVARAVCEVVVRRSRNYCDPAEAADLATPAVRPINKSFGRHFETVSFRWLSPSEI